MGNARLLELRPARQGDRDVTLYVKGFLSRGEEPDHFESWCVCHEALEASHGWGSAALGYHWPSGNFWSRPVAVMGSAKAAWDLIRIARNARRAARLSYWGAMLAEETALVASRFVHQYWSWRC